MSDCKDDRYKCCKPFVNNSCSWTNSTRAGKQQRREGSPLYFTYLLTIHSLLIQFSSTIALGQREGGIRGRQRVKYFYIKKGLFLSRPQKLSATHIKPGTVLNISRSVFCSGIVLLTKAVMVVQCKHCGRLLIARQQ